jgi:hypothetical protein
MASLGEFGAARTEADPERERDTFTFCGVEFLVAEQMDPLALLEFGEAAASGLDGDDPAGMAAVLALIRASVDEADWPKFRKTVRQHRPPIDDLMAMAMAVVQRETGRPTVPASDSSSGSSATGESSKALSSSAASSHHTWRDTPFGRRELAAVPELYEGMTDVDTAGEQVSATG